MARHRVRWSLLRWAWRAVMGSDAGLLFLFAGYCAVASWALWAVCATPSG